MKPNKLVIVLFTIYSSFTAQAAMDTDKPSTEAKNNQMTSKPMSGMKAKSGMMANKVAKNADKAEENPLRIMMNNINNKAMGADLAFTLALQNPARPIAERAKDIDRKPQQVLEFAGIKPGMRVLNLLSYYGYYTEVLAYRVGEKGTVYAQNTPTYSSTGKNIEQRLEINPLSNVHPYVIELKNIEISKPVDAIMFMSSFHDFHGFLAKDKTERINILKNLQKSLKPGGNLIISDMVEAEGEHNPKMHRIHKQIVLDELIDAGFKLVDSSDMLRKPELDDHSTIGYDKKRFYTDRWLMKLTY